MLRGVLMLRALRYGTYSIEYTVEHAAEATSHDMLSRNRVANCTGPARNSFLYSSYVLSPFTTQNTKHKGAHNHDITMTKERGGNTGVS
jgi:hypothetical protein